MVPAERDPIEQLLLKSENAVNTDETYPPVLTESVKKRSGRQIRLFRNKSSHARACTKAVLKGFYGTLIADGNSICNGVHDGY